MPCYRIFLSRFGASLVKGFEVHGLDPNLKAGEMPQWSDVVESTLWLRPDCLPENTIEISHDGMGNGYCLKCSEADPQYDGPVIEWVPEHNGGKEVFASFLEFIEEHCSP
ncbi:MAG: SMI1/KNR4 family protein [Candidatus Thiodiazotropha sp.]